MKAEFTNNFNATYKSNRDKSNTTWYTISHYNYTEAHFRIQVDSSNPQTTYLLIQI